MTSLKALVEQRADEGRGRQDPLAHRLGAVERRRVLTEPGAFTDVVVGAVAEVTGRKPKLSTTGGTSDARFIKDYCPVVEFGLVGADHARDRRARAGRRSADADRGVPQNPRRLFRLSGVATRRPLASLAIGESPSTSTSQ